jgi:hypothetical protein
MRNLIWITALLLGGCYTTRLNTIPPGQPVYEDRQWFLLWGIGALNDPAHAGCTPTAVESEMSFVDGLLSFVAAGVGEAIVYGVCKDSGSPGTCAAAGTLISASLVSPRTIRWSCSSPRAAGPADPPPAPDPAKCLIVGSTRCNAEKDTVEVCGARKQWAPALECTHSGRRCFAAKPRCASGAACCWSAEGGELLAPRLTVEPQPLAPAERIPLVDPGAPPPPAPEPPAPMPPPPEPPPRKVAIPKP